MENVLNVTIMRTGNFFAGNYIRKNGWILHGRTITVKSLAKTRILFFETRIRFSEKRLGRETLNREKES